MIRERSASDTAHAVPAARAVPSRSRVARDPAFPGTGALGLAFAACAMAIDAGGAPLALLALGLAASGAILGAASAPADRLAVVRSRASAAPGRRLTGVRSSRNG